MVPGTATDVTPVPATWLSASVYEPFGVWAELFKHPCNVLLCCPPTDAWMHMPACFPAQARSCHPRDRNHPATWPTPRVCTYPRGITQTRGTSLCHSAATGPAATAAGAAAASGPAAPAGAPESDGRHQPSRAQVPGACAGCDCPPGHDPVQEEVGGDHL
jgi:hypothetical protein